MKPYNVPFDTPFEKIPIIYRKVFDFLPQIEKALQININDGENLPAFGIHRLYCVELISKLVAIKFICLYEKLLQNNLFEILLDLLMKYHLNNILHSYIIDCFNSILLCENNEIINQVSSISYM